MQSVPVSTARGAALLLCWRWRMALTTTLQYRLCVKLFVNGSYCGKATPSIHKRITHSWTKIAKKLKGSKPWRSVAGPIGTLMMTLRRSGWNAKTPRIWTNASGDDFHILNTCVRKTLLKYVTTDTEKLLWAKAAKHYNGRGLEKGGGLHHY